LGATSLIDCRGMICQAFRFVEGMVGGSVRYLSINVMLRDRYGRVSHRWHESLAATPKGGSHFCMSIPCMQLSWRFWFGGRFTTLFLNGRFEEIVWRPRTSMSGRLKRSPAGALGMLTLYGYWLHYRTQLRCLVRRRKGDTILYVFDSSPCPKIIRRIRKGFVTTNSVLHFNDAGAFMTGCLSPVYPYLDGQGMPVINYCILIGPEAVGAVCKIVKQGAWCVEDAEVVELSSFGTRLGDPVMSAEFIPQPDPPVVRFPTSLRMVRSGFQ